MMPYYSGVDTVPSKTLRSDRFCCCGVTLSIIVVVGDGSGGIKNNLSELAMVLLLVAKRCFPK